MDPCLFVIDKHKGPKSPTPLEYASHNSPLPEGIDRSWVLIHTDDCDAYGMSLDVLKEINAIMDKEWATELVDRSEAMRAHAMWGSNNVGPLRIG